MEWFNGPEHQPFHFVAGTGESAVLLLHGFMGTPAEMLPLGATFTSAGVAARAIQLPGMGRDIARLGAVTRHDWLVAASDAWHELAARYDRVAVLGYSMGGAIALRLAANVPVDRLILVAPLWRLLAGNPLSLLMPLLPVIKRVVHEVQLFRGTDFSDPDVHRSLNEMMSSLDLDDPAAQRELRCEAVLPTSTLDELRRLTARAHRDADRVTSPATVIQGSWDQVVRAGDTRRLVTRFRVPVAYHQVPGGHMLVRDDADGWTGLRDLIRQIAGDLADTPVAERGAA